MNTIAIIPARGGSKEVLGKNIIPIHGKPLIIYTIEAALRSKLLKDIWVSSDDEKILNVAKSYEGLRLHKRDKSIAQDHSPISETLLEILNLYGHGNKPDAIMLLQPTSPIRESDHIDAAISALASQPNMKSLISVCAMDDVHPARMYWKKKDELKSILPEYENHHRQDIPKAYYRNGSIYLTRTVEFLSTCNLMVKPALCFEMPSELLLNIDSPRDLLIAEPLIKAWENDTLL